MLGDHRRDVRRLAPVEREQGGQRHEHRQPDAGGAVVVDAEAGPVTGRREARVADGPPSALADVAGGLEIDERDGVIGPDHDVRAVRVGPKYWKVVRPGGSRQARQTAAHDRRAHSGHSRGRPVTYAPA